MTYETIPYASVAARPQVVKNRRGGLIAFGVLSILIGMPFTLLAGSAALLTVRMAVTGVGPLMPFEFVPVLAVITALNATAATVFIWTGVGSIRCRRWVRPVVLGIGWPTLVTSLLMAAGILIYAGEPRAWSAEGYVILAVLILIFGVLLPMGYLGFYTSAAVRETLAAYDPSPSWTDATPLPVFVGCVSLVLFGLLTMALSLVQATPAFGVYVTGVAGALLAVGAGAVMIASAVGMYLGRRWGWWLAMTVVAGGFASAIVTMGVLGPLEFYRHGGMRPWALDELGGSRVMTGVTPVIFVGMVMAVSVNYLLWIRPMVGGAGGGDAQRRHEGH